LMVAAPCYFKLLAGDPPRKSNMTVRVG